jgi:hypothetical protein
VEIEWDKGKLEYFINYKITIMTQKTIKSLVLFFAAALFVLGGCEKDEFTDNPELNELTKTEQSEIQTDYIFFIDDEEATEQEYNTLTKKTNELLLIQTTVNDKNALYAYTTEAGYIAYGERNGLNLKGELEFSKHMSEYAETSGAITEYEKTGNIPENYTKYEKQYYERLFDKPAGEKGYGKLCDYHNGGGSYIPFVNGATTPALPKSWRNRISSVHNAVGVAVYTVPLYNKTWYRDKLITVVVTPFPGDRIHNLIGSRDNAAESFIVF